MPVSIGYIYMKAIRRERYMIYPTYLTSRQTKVYTHKSIHEIKVDGRKWLTTEFHGELHHAHTNETHPRSGLESCSKRHLCAAFVENHSLERHGSDQPVDHRRSDGEQGGRKCPSVVRLKGRNRAEFSNGAAKQTPCRVDRSCAPRVFALPVDARDVT